MGPRDAFLVILWKNPISSGKICKEINNKKTPCYNVLEIPFRLVNLFIFDTPMQILVITATFY